MTQSRVAAAFMHKFMALKSCIKPSGGGGMQALMHTAHTTRFRSNQAIYMISVIWVAAITHVKIMCSFVFGCWRS